MTEELVIGIVSGIIAGLAIALLICERLSQTELWVNLQKKLDWRDQSRT